MIWELIVHMQHGLLCTLYIVNYVLCTDGFFHHVMWGKHKIVFIVPLVDGEIKVSTGFLQP